LISLICISLLCLDFKNVHKIPLHQNKFSNIIPELISVKIFIISSLLCSNIIFLLSYITTLFGARSRGIVLGLIFTFCFGLITCVSSGIFGKVFQKEFSLKILFFATILNIFVLCLMPEKQKSKVRY
jgi:uncharacterized membrane-anchored protein